MSEYFVVDAIKQEIMLLLVILLLIINDGLEEPVDQRQMRVFRHHNTKDTCEI